jgi:hypothetical protein
MSLTASSVRSRVRHLGRDLVELRGDSLTITTPVRDLPGWQVRKYRAPVVRFEGRSWRITTRTPLPDRTTRFELVAWDPGDGEIPGSELEYSPESVALRDHALKLGRRRSRGTMLLNYVGPLTGFLPASTKDRLEVRYGIDPGTSTKWSVFIQFLVAIGCFVLTSIGTMVIALGYPSPIAPLVVLAIGVLAAVDGSVRWGRLLSEERPAPGFYEWLFRRRK